MTGRDGGWGGLRRDERGATMVEYGLIALMVVLGGMVAIVNFGSSVVTLWNDMAAVVLSAFH